LARKYALPKSPSEAARRPHADPPDVAPPPNGDLSPLAIILTTMRQRYVLGDLDGAIALARIAAPYLHPRLPASVPPADLAAMTDADLDAFRPQD
jgi:hypothetical protein